MKLKLLIVDTGFLYGSGRVPILAKINFWKTLDWDITILTTTQGAAHYRRFTSGLNFILIGKGPDPHNRLLLIFELFRRILITFTLTKKILSKDFQVIYSISSVTDLLIFPLLLKLLRPSLIWTAVFDNTVTLSGSGPFIIRFLALVFYKISLFLLHPANALFVISLSLKKYLQLQGFKSNQLVITGNGVEGNLINKARFRSRYATSAIYMGRLNETKGIYDLLTVVEQVRPRHPDFILGLLGHGDASSLLAFKQAIKTRGLSKNIKFLGFQSGQNKYDYLKSSRVFIFLSPKESFGVALLEALSLGLPAIVYDLPAYRHLGAHSSLYRVKKADVTSAASTLSRLLNNTSKPTPDTHLLNKYSWDKLAQIESDSIAKLLN